MSNLHKDRGFGKPLYQESIGWSLPVWAFVIFMDLSILLAIWAALPISATWISLCVLCIFTLLAYLKSKLRVTVTQGWLIAGPAAIERAFIYGFETLDAKQMRLERGINAHPLNYLQIRFWIPGGIAMKLRDPRDQTPKWIISTRNKSKLVEILENAKH